MNFNTEDSCFFQQVPEGEDADPEISIDGGLDSHEEDRIEHMVETVNGEHENDPIKNHFKGDGNQEGDQEGRVSLDGSIQQT